ncbi:MAG: hypothetical protein IPN95_20450 [Bacteroidetes bacterium]|nr:hypothetical protein [Bacteroidota bacterium]
MLILGSAGSLSASHYAGNEIIVEWLNGENYRITQRIYRDCSGIALGTTTIVNFVPSTPVASATLNRVGNPVDITPLCPGQVSPCPNTGGAFGIEEHIYSLIVTLLPTAAYRVQLQPCARNAAITTGDHRIQATVHLRNFRAGNSKQFSSLLE